MPQCSAGRGLEGDDGDGRDRPQSHLGAESDARDGAGRCK